MKKIINLIKKPFSNIETMSIPGAMVLSAVIVGASVFVTTWIFFGGDNNRQKLSIPSQYARPVQTNTLTQQQIQQLQLQRAQMMQLQASSTQAQQVYRPATTTPVKTTTKK